MMQNTYAVTIEHPQLGKQREIKGRNNYIAQQRAKLQLAQWEQQWQQQAKLTTNTPDLIAMRNQAAQQLLSEIQQLLSNALQCDCRIDWQKLKITLPEIEPKPQPPLIEKPTLFKLPARPEFDPAPQRELFYTQTSLLGKWLKPIKTKQEQVAETAYQQALQDYQKNNEQMMQRWQVRHSQIEAQNAKELERYNQRLQSAQQVYETALKRWNSSHGIDINKIKLINQQIDDYQAAYQRQEASAVLDYCDMVLSDSPYPECWSKQFSLEYQAVEKLLIVNYCLPQLSQMPSLQNVIGIKNSNLIREVHLSDKEIKQLYENTLYQMALRSCYELFSADTSQALQQIQFNGYISQASNQHTILSLQSDKARFTALDLTQLEPKQAFAQLAGIIHSPLLALSANSSVISRH
jgi:restriction system protein